MNSINFIYTCTVRLVSTKLLYVFLQFQQLEDLGWHAFAFGFHGDAVELVGTSTAITCCNSKVLEYLHALIVAGKLLYNIDIIACAHS